MTSIICGLSLIGVLALCGQTHPVDPLLMTGTQEEPACGRLGDNPANCATAAPSVCPPDCRPGDDITPQVFVTESVCLVKMEAAMRAMDLFIPRQLTLMTDGANSWWEPYRTIHYLEEPSLLKAMMQWDAVKRECWKAKP